ncbi:hypothetical protein OAS39_02965 [Pirellulales bacterium]|nr:hypothetical protein [Pirellulales bacterium]
MLQQPQATIDPRELPGPDTMTKREATQVKDARFQYMLREAAQVSWPEAYTDDLYLHDRRILESHPEGPLLWMLRSHGTHLFPLECENSGQAHYAREVIRYWSGDHKLNVAQSDADRARYYRVTRHGLQQITWSEALDEISVTKGDLPS